MHDASNTEYNLLRMSESDHDFSFYQRATKFLYRLRCLFWLSEKINDNKLRDYIVFLVKATLSLFKFYFINTIRHPRQASILFIVCFNELPVSQATYRQTIGLVYN